MNTLHTARPGSRIPGFTTRTLLFSIGSIALLSAGCGATEEAVDDFNSKSACEKHCTKKYDCADKNPTGDQTEACVNGCRDSIEDNCGNEHQAAATDKIEDCVDQACPGYTTCMVFEVAPECFGFVEN